MRRRRSIVFATLLGATLCGCQFIINQLAFHPDRSDPFANSGLPAGIEERFVRTQDGVRIQLLYLPPADSGHLLIYFHGNAGNIYHRIPDLQRLHRLGVGVIGVSYRGYGKSDGSPSEEGIYRDGEAALNHALEVLGVPQRNIILLGRSIGTTVAVNTARNRTIGGLILVSPLTSGKAHARAMGLGFLSPLAGSAFDNRSKMAQITAPLLVIHGTADRVIPFSMGRQLFEHARSQKRFVALTGAGHNNLQADFGPAYWSAIADFIRQVSG